MAEAGLRNSVMLDFVRDGMMTDFLDPLLDAAEQDADLVENRASASQFKRR